MSGRIRWDRPNSGSTAPNSGSGEALAQLTAEMSRKASEALDIAIRRAISNHLGHEDWQPEDIAHRGLWVTTDGDPIKTLTMDGIPIFRYGPIEVTTGMEGYKAMYHTTQAMQILNEKPEDRQ